MDSVRVLWTGNALDGHCGVCYNLEFQAATILKEESYSCLEILQDVAVQVMPSVLFAPFSLTALSFAISVHADRLREQSCRTYSKSLYIYIYIDREGQRGSYITI